MKHGTRSKLTPALVALVAALAACAAQGGSSSTPRSAGRSAHVTPPDSQAPRREPAVPNSARVAHVFVALCDNVHQGIVPVPARLGDGDAPASNLYWGAAFGVKTFFKRSSDWQLVAESRDPRPGVLERLVFSHRRLPDTFLVADAYRGREIESCTLEFLEAASGSAGETLDFEHAGRRTTLRTSGSAALVAYVGHDGLMDFQLPYHPRRKDDARRDAVVLACASKNYFAPALRETGANPLLWTTNLMAPEAYVLDAALSGWLARESGEQVRARAAAAYHKYQRCGLRAATRLFASGF
jgi:hypothetical protein